MVMVGVMVMVMVQPSLLVLAVGTSRRLVGGTDGTTACAACPTLACGTPDSILPLVAGIFFFLISV